MVQVLKKSVLKKSPRKKVAVKRKAPGKIAEPAPIEADLSIEAEPTPPAPESVVSEVVALNPKEIISEERVRKDLGDINELVSSIQEVGQIQPITVFIDRDGQTVLEAGERRRRACIQLDRTVAAVFIDVPSEYDRLTRQLHENFKRKDFDILEAADGLLRQKSLYDLEHKSASHGGSGRGRPKDRVPGSDSLVVPRFSLVAAKEMSCGETKVRDLLAISSLPKEYKRKIEAAKTSGERNRVAQECLQKVRQDRKLEALQQAAEEKRQLIAEHTDEAAAVRDQIVVRYGDNKDFLIGQELFEVCLTDPPYDRERNTVQHTTRASMNPTEYDWDKLDVGWVLRVAPMLTKGGHLIVFCPLEYIGAYEVAIKAAELDYRSAMVWVRSNPAPVHRDCYASATEGIVWATKPGAKPYFNPEAAKAGASSWNVIQGPGVPGSAKDRVHPTQKPTWLMERLLINHASPDLGHRVIDPFAGSGTTGVACQNLKLQCTLIERDEDFVKSAKLRLEAAI